MLTSHIKLDQCMFSLNLRKSISNFSLLKIQFVLNVGHTFLSDPPSAPIVTILCAQQDNGIPPGNFNLFLVDEHHHQTRRSQNIKIPADWTTLSCVQPVIYWFSRNLNTQTVHYYLQTETRNTFKIKKNLNKQRISKPVKGIFS